MSSGTGIHGYTGGSATGKYNIQDGIIQSSAPSTNANDLTYYGGSNNIANSVGSAIASAMTSANNNIATTLASQVAGKAGTDASDYGQMIRDILSQSQANTAQSQQFAREQMDYQTQSDRYAMAWSAQEAAKNRAWQESLSDTAHQREVRDLVAAGLNPILSANQGAYTGSGATGQGFASSGAMGQVDSTGIAAAGSLMASKMNNATQAMIAKLYTETSKYQADLDYSAARLQAETSILNNENSNSAQKWMTMKNIEADLERTKISGEYGLREAGIHADASIDVADINNRGADRRENLSQQGQNYRANLAQSGENYRQFNELNQRDREILAAYERTALQVYNSLNNAGGITTGLENGEKFLRECAKALIEFKNDPSGTYDRFKKNLMKGSEYSFFARIFGQG